MRTALVNAGVIGFGLMPGSFDLNPIAGGLATAAVPVAVVLYDPSSANPYTILPNVRCLRIDFREGPEPPVARFQYWMDDLLAAFVGWPSQFEKLWPIDAQGAYVVQNDDRLLVLTQNPAGDPVVLLDGFAQIPQVDLSAQTQTVTFAGISVAVRLWDTPISYRIQRDSSNVPTTDGSADVIVELPTRFNPSDTSIGAQGGYIGNATPGVLDTVLPSGATYAVFTDPLLVERVRRPTTGRSGTRWPI